MQKLELMRLFWSQRLGFSPEDLSPGVHQCVGGEKGRFLALWYPAGLVFRSNPEALLSSTMLEEMKHSQKLPNFLNVTETYISYYMEKKVGWEAPASPQVRRLQATDLPALKVLRGVCTERDNQLGQVGDSDPVIYGFFEGEYCLAAASFLYFGKVADIGVLVHPAHRRRGLGGKVVQSLSMQGLADGYCLHYGAISENVPSLKLAEKWGFSKYGIFKEGAIDRVAN